MIPAESLARSASSTVQAVLGALVGKRASDDRALAAAHHASLRGDAAAAERNAWGAKPHHCADLPLEYVLHLAIRPSRSG
jgi:hypothetical protein